MSSLTASFAADRSMSSFVPSFDLKRLTDWDRPHGRYVEKLFIHVHAFSPVDVRASRHEQVEQRLHFVLRVIDAVLQTLPKPLKGLTESAVPADYMPTPTTLQGAVEMLAIFFAVLVPGHRIFEAAKPFFEEEREVLDAYRESMGRPDSPSPEKSVADFVLEAKALGIAIDEPDETQQIDPRLVYRLDLESQHLVPASIGDEGPYYQIDKASGRLAQWIPKSNAEPSRAVATKPLRPVETGDCTESAIAALQRKFAELEARPVYGGNLNPLASQVPGGSDGAMPRVNTTTRPFKAVHTEPEHWWHEFAAGATLRDFVDEMRLQYVTSPSTDKLSFPFWTASLALEQESDLRHLSDLVKEKLDRYDQDGCGALELSWIMTLEGRLVKGAAGRTEAAKFEKRHLDLTDKSELLRDLWKGVKMPGTSQRSDKSEKDDPPRKAPAPGGKGRKSQGRSPGSARSRSTSPTELPPKVDIPARKPQPKIDADKFSKLSEDAKKEINKVRLAGEAWSRDEAKRLLAIALNKRA